jgi:hypothetical protein
MLDKLNRNNFSAFTALLALCLATSCGYKERRGEIKNKREKVVKSHTVISCPGLADIVLRYTTVREVEEAIKRAIDKKRDEKTSETYTAIRFSQNRSVKINIMPEDMIKCNVTEIPPTQKESQKAHFFFR